MLEFKIETMDKPEHHFEKEKVYFPFEKLGAPSEDGLKVQGFEVPIEYKSRVNYQLNAVVKNKTGDKRKIGLNKIQDEKEYRMTKSNREGYFKVVRVK